MGMLHPSLDADDHQRALTRVRQLAKPRSQERGFYSPCNDRYLMRNPPTPSWFTALLKGRP
jgi:hypothetical protein